MTPGADPSPPGARGVTHRAIRRLDRIEWLLISVALLLALGGGALAAWILVPVVGGSFRFLWAILALLLLVLPAVGLRLSVRARSAERVPLSDSLEKARYHVR